MRLSMVILLALASLHPTAAADVTPEKLAAALAELEKLTGQTMTKTGVPGLAIVVVHQDRIVYAKGFGVREAGQAERIDADTVFLLASVSKPITSTIVAIQVSRGAVDWDDRVIDRDPDFRLFDPVTTRELTLRDLLCHRSGLADHEGDLLEDMGYDRAEVLHRLRYAKPASSFRSRYAYTNFGITEAAVAAARPTGKSWEDLAAETLYRPLGMNSTSSRFKDFAAAKNRAKLHVLVDGKWAARYVRDPDAQAPAGGVSSTANDLGKWLRLQLAGGKFEGQQIIKTAALDETHRPQLVNHPPSNPATDRAGFYGLCWNVSYDDQGRVRLGHSGAFDMGAATVVNLLLSEGLGIAILTNTSPKGIPEALAASFLDLALTGKIDKDYVAFYEQAFKEILKPPYGAGIDYTKQPQRSSPALPSKAYLGIYRNDYFGPIEIVEAPMGLHMRLGPKKASIPIRHWDRDVFLYQPVGEMAAGLSTVTFTIGPDQRAVNVVLENLNTDGQGTFARSPGKK